MTNTEKDYYLDEFLEVNRDGWVTVGNHVQYKLVGKTLYFQCSSGEEDWKSNFDFWARPYKNMKEVFYVHKGFRDMWKSVRDEIAKLDFDTIIGYSQGAALTLPTGSGVYAWICLTYGATIASATAGSGAAGASVGTASANCRVLVIRMQ